MARTNISIETRDGRARATLFRPDIGEGPWPPVLVYHDGRGYRPSQFELAQRIASAGYLVLLPDLFYRAGEYTAPTPLELSQNAELRQAFGDKYRATASKSNVRSDTESFLAFLAEQKDASTLATGTTGYCFSGGLSLAAAAHFPDRVVAAASYHGGNLATEDADSPHLLAGSIKARVYVAGAVEDASFPDTQKQRLIEALSNARVEHVVETYPGAKHGWVPSDSLVFDAQASDRHYQTLLALFEATLRRAPRK